MNNEKKIQHDLNDLIEIARDGNSFYNEAAGKVDNPELSSLFTRMADHKREIVNGLTAEVAAVGGEPAARGTMAGSMREAYAGVRASLGDRDYAYVSELEELEDRLLDAFKDTVGDDDTPAAARAAAQKYLPQVTECHDINARQEDRAAGRALRRPPGVTLRRDGGAGTPASSAAPPGLPRCRG